MLHVGSVRVRDMEVISGYPSKIYIYIYSFYVLVCLHTELHMVELHENTNINRNEQLEHVSCSIIVSSFCFGSTDVQGHKQCSGTQQNSGFAIQHVSTFMLTVVKFFFII